MINISNDIGFLKWFSRHEEYRRKKFMEDTISLVENQSIPWPKEILERLSQMNIEQAHKVLEQHTGHSLSLIWQSIENLLKIFNANSIDFESSLKTFHKKAQSADFFSRRGRREFKQIHLQINKNMYNLASVAEAVFQVTQRFRGKFNPEEYTDNFDHCYSNNKVYQFIKGLRVALNHQQFAKPHYQIRIIGETHETEFFLKSSELLSLSCFKAKAKDFISEAGDKIYVRPVFDNHKENIRKFYDWVNGQLKVDQRFSDYQRCKLVPIKAGQRVSFSIMLQQMEERKLNPYDYLDQNFTDEELTEIRKLSPRSKVQIDRIIEFYDEYNACTGDMREKVYKLFKVI